MTYSPNLGRWLQTDPIDFKAGDTNLYREVGNNPVNATDPSGLDKFWTSTGGRGETQLYFTGTYTLKFWKDNWSIYIGDIVEKNGRVYVQYGGYLVPKEKVEAELSANWKDWQNDKNKREDWFKANAQTDFSSTWASGMRELNGRDVYGTVKECQQMGLDAYRDTYVKGPVTIAGVEMAGAGIQIAGTVRGTPASWGCLIQARQSGGREPLWEPPARIDLQLSGEDRFPVMPSTKCRHEESRLRPLRMQSRTAHAW